MKSDSGDTVSLWMTEPGRFDRSPLESDTSAEVCIVGAGMAGMSVAYHLVRAGRTVVVVDDGPIGGGETGRTTAHLANEMDDRIFELERLHGTEGARMAVQSHGAAIDRIESIANEERIDCDFRRVDGYLFAGPGGNDDDIPRELEAAHRVGLRNVQRLPRIPGLSFDSGPCLHFPGQGQFHPLKYLDALARAVEARGGRIHTGSHVADFEPDDERPRLKTTEGHTITAESVVFATNTPVNDWVKIHTKQAAYRTYVVTFEVPRGSVPFGLYWDNLDPYHYVRLQPGEGSDGPDFLIVGGEDHKTGQTDDYVAPFRRIEEWARERFPAAAKVSHRWSGQVMEPVDYLGFIGRNPGDEAGVYIATGDSGQGITHSTIAGMLISDLILGKANAWEKLYDPARITLRAAGEFLRENLNVAVQYGDLATRGEVSAPSEIAPGTGAVIRRGAQKLAVYRDVDGNVHERSALCTHLYCVVAWNHVEKSWDCPCHGSRFDPYGKVLNGPAISPLGEVEEDTG